MGLIAPLFNPRIDAWREHIRWDGAEIVPVTPVGRATAALLRLNDPERVSLRSNLMLADLYPFLAR